MTNRVQAPTIRIGPYYEGEIPEDFLYQFLDSNGDADPLPAGAVATARLQKGTADAADVDGALVSSESNGQVTYSWNDDDTDTSGVVCQLQFVVTGGGQIWKSAILVFRVLEAL